MSKPLQWDIPEDEPLNTLFDDKDTTPKGPGAIDRLNSGITNTWTSITASLRNVWACVMHSLRFMPILANMIGWACLIGAICNSVNLPFIQFNSPMRGLAVATSNGVGLNEQEAARGIIQFCGNQIPLWDTSATCKIWVSKLEQVGDMPDPIADVLPSMPKEEGAQ